MSVYKDEISKYKAKRAGIVDAKVVAPKGRKKKVDKPWVVVTVWGSFPQWGPTRDRFEKERDARAYLRKQRLYKTTTVSLFFNGEEVQ